MSLLPRGSRTGQATSSRTASRYQPFTDAESVSFLRRTVRSLGEENGLAAAEDARRASEAKRLAMTLGHLPIAVEHAAAYLAETGQSVEGYLNRFTGTHISCSASSRRTRTVRPGLGHLGDVDHAAES